MKKLIFALFLFSFSAVFAQVSIKLNGKHAMGGSFLHVDKAAHFFGNYTTYSVLRKGLPKKIAIPLTIAIWGSKELIWDGMREQGSGFSLKDAAANMAGLTFGVYIDIRDFKKFPFLGIFRRNKS